MTNIVLMAGKGSRFKDAGYTISKPLLPVLGKPMIIRAIECMPPADHWIFVLRQEHLEEENLIVALKGIAKDVVLIVDPNPRGQLLSCLEASSYLDTSDVVFIGACDFGMIYNSNTYHSLATRNDMPSIIPWSFTKHDNLVRNPAAWGWLVQDENSIVSGISVKKPISEDPYHDFALTGSFTFRNGKEFLSLAEGLMKSGTIINGEYYIDSMIGVAREKDLLIQSFTIDRYIGWGVPADYETYLSIEKSILHRVGTSSTCGSMKFPEFIQM